MTGVLTVEGGHRLGTHAHWANHHHTLTVQLMEIDKQRTSNKLLQGVSVQRPKGI